MSRLVPGLETNGSQMIGSEPESQFEYRLEHDLRFLRRIEQARNSLRAERGLPLEDIDLE